MGDSTRTVPGDAASWAVDDLGLRDGDTGRAGKRADARLVRATDRDAHALVLDLDLPDPGFLDDLDELADALPALGVDVADEERRLARVTLADRLQQRLGLLAEHREQHEILLGRRKALRRLANVVHARRVVLECGRLAREQLDRTPHAGVDLTRRRPVPARDELAELVEHRAVAARRQHVEQRLRPEDQADRRRERRPARLVADPRHLGERVEQAVARRVRAEVEVERRDEARGQVVLGRTDGDARGERRERLVAEMLVDDVGRFPETGDVDAGGAVEPLQHLDERLPCDSVQRQRERIDRRRHHVGAHAGRDERVGERRAARRLDVEADRAGRSPRAGARRAPASRAGGGRRWGRSAGRARRRGRRPSAPARRAHRSRRRARGCTPARRAAAGRPRRSPHRPRRGSRRR